MNIDNNLRQELNCFSVGNKKDSAAFTVYVHLIVNANYADSDKAKRGQMLTSFRKLSEETGLSEQQVRTAVKNLISANYIKQRSTRNYTVFTLCHYDIKNNAAEFKKSSKEKKPLQAQNNTLSAAEKERYLKLCEKIRSEPLEGEDKEFFNNYNYAEE